MVSLVAGWTAIITVDSIVDYMYTNDMLPADHECVNAPDDYYDYQLMTITITIIFGFLQLLSFWSVSDPFTYVVLALSFTLTNAIIIKTNMSEDDEVATVMVDIWIGFIAVTAVASVVVFFLLDRT